MTTPAEVAAPAADSLPAARRSLGRRLALPAVALLCLSGGVAGGMAAKIALVKPVESEPPAAHAPAPLEPVPHPTPRAALVRADALLAAGAFGEALAACRDAPRGEPADERSLAYREGMCLEALGRLKEATDAYRRAESSEGSRAAWARAALGRARCSDDPAAARALLDQVVLRSGHPDCAGSHIFEECLFLRARFDAIALGPVRAMDPFDPDAVAWPALGGGLDHYAEWLPADTVTAASSGPVTGPNVVAKRASDAVGGFRVTAHLPERPTVEQAEAVAAAAGLKIRFDPAAGAALGLGTAVDVEAMPLGELLGGLLDRFGAVWKLESDTLTVTLGAAPSGRADAERSSRRALAAAPGHPRARAIRIWLANFAFVAGRTHEGAKGYESILDDAPESPEAAHAAYNLGLAELRTGADRSARTRFLSLVDRAPRGWWADYGWWWIGRLLLDDGDPGAARKAFRTALGGATREVASAAAIGVCACELLDGNDDAARTVLDDTRVAVRETHMRLAAALGSLLRYRAAPTDGRKTLLLAALREATDGRALGLGGVLLIGRTYRDLGMGEKTVALYDAAAAIARGPLAVRMTFDAAAWYDLMDRHDAARQRYLAVAATDPKGFGPEAELRLAGLALRAGKAAECVRRCRALTGRSGVSRDEVLVLMGRGYERLRNYRLAAECFAGRVPVE